MDTKRVADSSVNPGAIQPNNSEELNNQQSLTAAGMSSIADQIEQFSAENTFDNSVFGSTVEASSSEQLASPQTILGKFNLALNPVMQKLQTAMEQLQSVPQQLEGVLQKSPLTPEELHLATEQFQEQIEEASELVQQILESNKTVIENTLKMLNDMAERRGQVIAAGSSK